MKIQVVRSSGDHEALTLTEPLTILRSTTDDGMNRLITATGMEHWFNTEGIYDGWSMAFSTPVPEDDALTFAHVIESEREVIP